MTVNVDEMPNNGMKQRQQSALKNEAAVGSVLHSNQELNEGETPNLYSFVGGITGHHICDPAV